ncbi:MAG: hypothetical protein IPN76_13075 [Saprospiraceae bacterium]|nr:hypothetical protein [Saprospiraceae bacterium]
METKVSVVGVNYSQPTLITNQRWAILPLASNWPSPKRHDFYAEPVAYLWGKMWGSLPVQLNDISMKVRLPEAALLHFLKRRASRDLRKFDLKAGQSINLNGKKITFAGVNKSPKPTSRRRYGRVCYPSRSRIKKRKRCHRQSQYSSSAMAK